MDIMVINSVSGRTGQTRAIVHVPRGKQSGEGPPVRVEATRRIDKTSRGFLLSERCAERYRQHARVYIPEMPAIVLDITR